MDEKPGRALAESPQRYARLGGMLYLFIIVVALFGEVFVRGRLIVKDDAAATAQRILGSEALFRAGVAGEMLVLSCDVALAMILYVLLRPVSCNLALLAAFFRLTFVAVCALSKVFLLMAVAVMQGAVSPQQLDARRLQELAYLALKAHSLGYIVSLIFFGFHCVVVGYLVRRAGYLPAALGALLVVAGTGYLVNSLAQILAPQLAAILFPWVLLPGFVAELGLCLWLMVKGIDMGRWVEPAFGAGH